MMSERQRKWQTDRQKYRQGDREAEENKRHRQREELEQFSQE